MRRALQLAERGKGWTLPNPMVGAVVLKNGQLIGEGFHAHFGGAHAEVEALSQCSTSPKEATVYVNLEPCCHQGKTPPCTLALIEAGVKELVFAAQDPSAQVNGQGAKELEAAGIRVRTGLCEEEARTLNRAFYLFHEQGRPWITLKAGVSLDGKIARNEDQRTYLTGEETQKKVHSLRHEHQAILVGAGTVLQDDPHLGVRAVEGRDPLRLILEGDRALPQQLKVFRDSNVLRLQADTPESLLRQLNENGILSVLVEGGHKVFSFFLKARLVDDLHLFYAPLFLGKEALSFTDQAWAFESSDVERCGPDFHCWGKPKF